MLDHFEAMLPRFVKVFPHEFKRVLGMSRARNRGNASASPTAPASRLAGRRSGGGSMGKTTGFLEYTREVPDRRPVAERINDWFEIYQDFPAEKVQHAGRPLHGLRRAVLPHRLPAEQLPFRTGTTWSIATAGATPSACCTPPTISRSSRDASARRRAKRPACWASTNRR